MTGGGELLVLKKREERKKKRKAKEVYSSEMLAEPNLRFQIKLYVCRRSL